MQNVLLGILIPFIGTTLGSSLVFFMKNKINDKIQKFLLGFAAGVMIAASVWSLLLPSMNMAKEQGIVEWIPACVGFLLGILFLLLLDIIIPHLHVSSTKPEGLKSNFKKTTMFFLAVTLHNIPEGMAAGVVFAGVLLDNVGLSFAGALALSIGIAIQNFPEGAIISMPLKAEGFSKPKAFFYGILSGIVEPIAALITILLTNLVVPILPYLLSFAAGAMVFVVVEELIPEMHENNKSVLGVVGVTTGFLVMMVLDIVLG